MPSPLREVAWGSSSMVSFSAKLGLGLAQSRHRRFFGWPRVGLQLCSFRQQRRTSQERCLR